MQYVFGELIPECDLFFNKNHRRPDLAYLTDAQIIRGAYGENEVPKFVIEIISTNVQTNLVYQKMNDFSVAGVKMIWLIFPVLQEIHVYSGNNFTNLNKYFADENCTAEPILKGFTIKVSELF
jgi:Uma2 family endonuclease